MCDPHYISDDHVHDDVHECDDCVDDDVDDCVVPFKCLIGPPMTCNAKSRFDVFELSFI